MKNIVICCDGTMARYGVPEENSNVVRLFERLSSDGPGQVSYYDPGVGTYSPARTLVGRGWAKAKMSVAGWGVRDNVNQAYRYLMETYESGDRVYLFGYSRGAYTVRLLAGMLHMCGLLTRGSDNLVPYATRLYRKRGSPKYDRIAPGFKKSFSRECRPHFIGVWDTVASVGLLRRKFFQDMKLNPDVSYGYQALSVDEWRTYFKPAVWLESGLAPRQTIE